MRQVTAQAAIKAGSSGNLRLLQATKAASGMSRRAGLGRATEITERRRPRTKHVACSCAENTLAQFESRSMEKACRAITSCGDV
eukprot:844680-Pleurochrysis_carterae.AAC.1